MQHLRGNFTYVPIVSRPAQPVPWTGATGHVQDIWQAGVLERIIGSRPVPETTRVFLCGSPRMIEDMLAILAREGFTECKHGELGQIHVEKYWQ